MRWLMLLMLAGCELVLPHHEGGGGGSCDTPPPGQNCSCSNNQWFCNTCPFYEGSGAVACSEPGRSCSIETWEHGCDCSCGADGWWYCFAETIGSHCPSGMPDAGVPEPIPDAAVDASPCQSIEAESVGVHTGWFDVYGPPSGGKGLQSLQAGTTFTFHFTGTTIAMTYLRGPTDGEISVSIDGGANIVVAAQYPSYDWVTAPLASALANAEHTVVVTCNAPQCSLDTFPVSCN